MKFIKILMLIALILAITLNSCKTEDTVIDPVLKKGWYNQVSETNLDLYDIFFIDENEGWATTGDGIFYSTGVNILHTTNGGAKWNILYTNISKSNYISTVYFQTNKIGFSTGYHVSKTTDGGKTWSIVLSDVSVGDCHIEFFDENNGYLIGSSVYQTTNGGNSWFELNSPFGNFYSLHHTFFFSENYIKIFEFEENKVYQTTDAGKTWNYKELSQVIFGAVNEMEFVTPLIGFRVGYDGISKTTDGGFTWTNTNANKLTNEAIHKLHFINKSIGWAISSSNILYTNDGGTTWVTQKSNIAEGLRSIFFVNDKKGWAVGYNGTILHTDTGGIE